MPSLNDIATIAESLEKRAVAVMQDRCVAVRNRNARCRRCEESCRFGAITVVANEVGIDQGSCVGCGACTVACPTEALVPLTLPDAQLASRVRAACQAADGLGVIACARIAARHVGDPGKFAEVPCLARVDESAVLACASAGAARVVLVDGSCSTCKHGRASASVDETVASVRGMFARDAAFAVERASAFPEQVVLESPEGKFGSTRRGFFSDAVNAAKDTALAAARAQVGEKLGPSSETASIGERLRVGDAGTLPQIRAERHERVLDALDALGHPLATTIETRLFAMVSIDVGRCNACGMCATFCPTGALRRGDDGGPHTPPSALEFTACDCVNCGMCADVCWKGCITLTAGLLPDELFELEPKVFELPGAARPKRPMSGR